MSRSHLRETLSTFLPLGVLIILGIMAAPCTAAEMPSLEYIDTSFENASPLTWEYDEQGRVVISLLYDHLRQTQHRAGEYQHRVASHWHFRIEAPKGSRQTIILNNLPRAATRMVNHTIISTDGDNWRVLPMECLDESRLLGTVPMKEASMYVARIDPYDVTDLDRFLAEIRDNPLVEITTIGSTVEGRPLEIVRIGHVDAPHRLFLRARCHPWESSGNWLVQGLIQRLLQGDARATEYLQRYCVYVLPMANKDGVVRGRARYNSRGVDLNRNLNLTADPIQAPENLAMQQWLKRMVDDGTPPDFAADFHNASAGVIIVTEPASEDKAYMDQVQRYHRLMQTHIEFTKNDNFKVNQYPGSFSDGLFTRYGINACIHEISSKWINALEDYPSAEHWEQYGARLCEVYYQFFEED